MYIDRVSERCVMLGNYIVAKSAMMIGICVDVGIRNG